MSNRADEPQTGTGLYRGPGETWPPQASERVPQTEFDGGWDNSGEAFLKMKDAIDQLGRAVAAATHPDGPTGTASGNTDASGNLYLPVYTVAAGEIFCLSRANVEAAGYNPGAVYTSAAAFAAFYATDSDIAPGGILTGVAAALQGSLLAFAPTVAAAQLFPWQYCSNDSYGCKVRGPSRLVLVVSGGPTTRLITVRYQGVLQRERGIV